MTTKSHSIYEHAYDIRSYEPHVEGCVPITAICNQLQDIASRHADHLGFGFRDLKNVGHFWMMSRACLMMDRLPGFGETSHVTTWPSGDERMVATRDYLIRDDTSLIGRATSNWVVVNLETHRACKPGDVLPDRHMPDVDRALTFPTRAIKRLKDGEFTTTITARRSDQDVNNHVNSVRYGEFCLEAVPQTWMDAKQCVGVDIQFRNESFARDSYVAACSATEHEGDMETMLHSLTRISDNREIVRMKTWWRKVG